MHPVLFSTPYFTVYSYGVAMALAMLLAWGLTSRLAARSSYPPEEASDILFILFAAGVAGARLFYVFQHPDQYAGRWQAVFLLQEGGLVWYGGFIGAVFAAALYTRVKRLSALEWADFFSPILPLAHAVGRLGCFFNGCCVGKGGHAVQLYESALLAALSAWLFFLFFRKRTDGEIFARYLVGYGTVRFALEFLRADQIPWMGLTLPQWISAACVLSGLLLYRFVRSHDPR